MTDKLFKDFLNGEIVMLVRKDDVPVFLKECDERGLKQCCGKRALKTIINSVYGFTSTKSRCVQIICTTDGLSVVPSDGLYGNIKRVLYCKKDANETKETINIDVNGRSVIATYYVDGKETLQSFATCHEDDEFDYTVGAHIAFERLEKAIKAHKKNNRKLDILSKIFDGTLYVQIGDGNQLYDVLCKIRNLPDYMIKSVCHDYDGLNEHDELLLFRTCCRINKGDDYVKCLKYVRVAKSFVIICIGRNIIKDRYAIPGEEFLKIFEEENYGIY